MLIKYNQDGSLNYIDGSNIFRKLKFFEWAKILLSQVDNKIQKLKR